MREAVSTACDYSGNYSRTQVQGEATEKLKDISIRHGFVVGKWYLIIIIRGSVPAISHTFHRLIFAPTDKVDLVWTTIASDYPNGICFLMCSDVPSCCSVPHLGPVSLDKRLLGQGRDLSSK